MKQGELLPDHHCENCKRIQPPLVCLLLNHRRLALPFLSLRVHRVLRLCQWGEHGHHINVPHLHKVSNVESCFPNSISTTSVVASSSVIKNCGLLVLDKDECEKDQDLELLVYGTAAWGLP